MRELRFVVNGMSLTKDPACDFTNIVYKSKGYLTLRFIFNDEWRNCKKVVKFSDNMFVSLDQFGGCAIPDEVCARQVFTVKLIGVRGDMQICTNTEKVIQTR